MDSLQQLIPRIGDRLSARRIIPVLLLVGFFIISSLYYYSGSIHYSVDPALLSSPQSHSHTVPLYIKWSDLLGAYEKQQWKFPGINSWKAVNRLTRPFLLPFRYSTVESIDSTPIYGELLRLMDFVPALADVRCSHYLRVQRLQWASMGKLSDPATPPASANQRLPIPFELLQLKEFQISPEIIAELTLINYQFIILTRPRKGAGSTFLSDLVNSLTFQFLGWESIINGITIINNDPDDSPDRAWMKQQGIEVIWRNDSSIPTFNKARSKLSHHELQISLTYLIALRKCQSSGAYYCVLLEDDALPTENLMAKLSLLHAFAAARGMEQKILGWALYWSLMSHKPACHGEHMQYQWGHVAMLYKADVIADVLAYAVADEFIYRKPFDMLLGIYSQSLGNSSLGFLAAAPNLFEHRGQKTSTVTEITHKSDLRAALFLDPAPLDEHWALHRASVKLPQPN